MRWTKLAAAVLLLATSATASHARMLSGSCTQGDPSIACNIFSGPSPSAAPHIIQVVPDLDEDRTAEFERRCRPERYMDSSGIFRFVYAHKSCGGDTEPRR